MPAATSNRLLPLLATVVVGLLLFVSLRSCSEDERSDLVLPGVPQAPAPDADSPADTIKTLTANVAAMTAEVEALRRDNTGLRKENQALLANRTQIEENVATRLRRELQSERHGEENRARIDSGVLTSLTQRVDRLAESLATTRTGSDIPVGLGFDGITPASGTDGGLVWVEPLDQEMEEEGTPARRSSTGLLGGLSERATTTATRLGEAVEKPRPVHTVPRNATLLGSTAMTALVGRIPVQGQVRDPMPFKVITGATNLAANGLTIPGVQGMVWSGTAVGDWTLSCVTGRLESVTFVFDDGTVRTLSSDDRQGQGEAKSLGWVSDAQGIPCISGERKSNAVAFLTQRIGVKAVQAAAEAAAAAETTSVVSDAGAVTDAVTGDTGAYVLGRTVAGGSDELAQWLLERQSQSFDAVFVPAGVPLAIHVDRELAIDFDPHGRRLSHAAPTADTRHARLD